MASGIIYLVIIAMWVAYFLPRWISVHEASSGKSAERFKSALRSVSDYAHLQTEEERSAQENAAREERLARITRRRYVLGALALIQFFSLGAMVLGMLSPITLAIPFSAIVLYILNIRRQINAEQIRVRRVQLFAKIVDTEVHAQRMERTIPIAMQTHRNEQPELFDEVVVTDAIDTTEERWVPLAERIEISPTVTILKRNPGSSREWQPTQVPKPIYATAPKAVSPRRNVKVTPPSTLSNFELEQEIINQQLQDERDAQQLQAEIAIPKEPGAAVNG